MKRFPCLVLLALPLAVSPAAEPANPTTTKAVVVLPAAADVDWLRVGSLVNVVVEEPGSPAVRTVFEARRVSAVAEEKDGLGVTVHLSAGQAKALEALKGGKVSVERYTEREAVKDDSKKPDDTRKPDDVRKRR